MLTQCGGGAAGLAHTGRLLGHTQPQTTARYAHLDDAALREATEDFGATVAPAAQGAPPTPLHRMTKEPSG